MGGTEQEYLKIKLYIEKKERKKKLCVGTMGGGGGFIARPENASDYRLRKDRGMGAGRGRGRGGEVLGGGRGLWGEERME